MKLAFVSAALLALAAPVAAQAQTASPAIAAALADSGRPEDQRARDADRHAAEFLAFTGIAAGDKVADFMMGGGYWTRILAPLVGPQGHVYAFQPAEFIAYRAAYAQEQADAVAGRANASAVGGSLAEVAFPEPLDAVITLQNWHDLHLAKSPAGLGRAVAQRIFDALKPGGTLIVVDHVANADPDFAVPQQLHRIDPAAARAEIESVGFVFDGESDMLRNPADPHSMGVFDPALRGHTDQFVYRFRKPE